MVLLIAGDYTKSNRLTPIYDNRHNRYSSGKTHSRTRNDIQFFPTGSRWDDSNNDYDNQSPYNTRSSYNRDSSRDGFRPDNGFRGRGRGRGAPSDSFPAAPSYNNFSSAPPQTPSYSVPPPTSYYNMYSQPPPPPAAKFPAK